MRRTTRMVAALAAASLAITACGDGGDDGDDGTTTDGAEDGATDGQAGDADLEGTQVAIFGAPTSVEADAINEVIEEYFNQPTGADAFYEGSDSFEEQVVVRIEGGNPPDIALYPQPGAVIEQAEAGNAISLEELGFDIAELEERFGDYLLGLGEYEGQHYGIPTNANLKSLVWYNIPVFEAEGYEIPETFDDLLALSQQMVDDGYTPWAIGTGSDAATGWPATDWMEDIVLRQAGPDAYDQWVSNELAFDSPEITEAAETFGEIVFGEGFVVGGPSAIPDIDFRDAPDAIVGDEPSALMHRQASFITNFFPEGAEFGTDYGVFPFPSIDGNEGALIAGELGVVFRDAPEVREFIEIFTGEEAQCAGGNFAGVSRISPNVNTTADCYLDEVVATSAETLLAALQEGTARFDASDLMPSEVGAGSFWTGMNEWMRGSDLDQVLTTIQNSWPAS
ncbi:carbohydrate ABC transporter substrate-binding protein [Nitriliruptoraceae bacterium ZYF776]|nr:carbohydrate ABC transporter substrate-binding protein [Profundirhabdus halotolerans]